MYITTLVRSRELLLFFYLVNTWITYWFFFFIKSSMLVVSLTHNVNSFVKKYSFKNDELHIFFNLFFFRGNIYFQLKRKAFLLFCLLLDYVRWMRFEENGKQTKMDKRKKNWIKPVDGLNYSLLQSWPSFRFVVDLFVYLAGFSQQYALCFLYKGFVDQDRLLSIFGYGFGIELVCSSINLYYNLYSQSTTKSI